MSRIDENVLIFCGLSIGVIIGFKVWQYLDRLRIKNGEYMFIPKRSAYQATALNAVIALVLFLIAYIIHNLFIYAVAFGMLIINPFFFQQE
ncbi:MAG: hypothetical protein JW884_12830 [Deltaproteobacteria bacterium]|nr:hypothetical protein [Deltaproteobacteria bacterium]